MGEGTVAAYDNQFVAGKYNANKEGTVAEFGNGTEESPSNAFEVYKDGHIEAGRSTTAEDGDKTLATKDYVDNNSGAVKFIEVAESTTDENGNIVPVITYDTYQEIIEQFGKSGRALVAGENIPPVIFDIIEEPAIEGILPTLSGLWNKNYFITLYVESVDGNLSIVCKTVPIADGKLDKETFNNEKSVLDGRLSFVENNKVDKQTTTSGIYVYSFDANGDSKIRVSNDTISDTLVLRSGTKVKTTAPTVDNDAVNLEYFNANVPKLELTLKENGAYTLSITTPETEV